MKQGHCKRCGSTEHLRSKCAQEARGWEVDFNKGAEFWTRTAGKLEINGKQARVQIWTGQSAVLCVQVEGELVILDSASDVSLGRLDALIDVHDSHEEVPIAHLEGHVVLDKEGEFRLPDGDSLLLYAVPSEQLPRGVVALFKSFHTEDEARRYMAESAKAVPPKPMKWKPHRRPGQSDAAFLKEQKALLTIAQAERKRRGLARYEGRAPTGPLCFMMMHVPKQDSCSQAASSSFQGRRALRAVAVVQMGTKTRYTAAAIDTMSDVTMALAKYLTSIHPIQEDTVHGINGAVSFTHEGTGMHLEAPAATMPALVGCSSYHRVRPGIKRSLASAGSASRLSLGREATARMVGRTPG